MNRREFIHVTAGAAVAASTAPRLAAQAQRTGSVGANDRVRLAIIGSGWSRQPGAHVVFEGAEQHVRRRVRRVQGAARLHRPALCPATARRSTATKTIAASSTVRTSMRS